MDPNLVDLLERFPSAEACLVWGPAAIAWSAACLLAAAEVKTRTHLETGYTRKLFHFLIFFSAAVIDFAVGFAGVLIFGAGTSLTIFYALARGSGHPLYEAIARESDAPRRSYFIVAPWLATLAGGMGSNLLFPGYAVVGYLVAGLGDAAAEPVGIRFGKHRYTVPSFRGVAAQRSVEGSAAVFLVSFTAIAIWLAILPKPDLTPWSLLGCALIAGVSTLVEAVSPHGWDNTTLQIIPAGMAAWLW